MLPVLLTETIETADFILTFGYFTEMPASPVQGMSVRIHAGELDEFDCLPIDPVVVEVTYDVSHNAYVCDCGHHDYKDTPTEDVLAKKIGWIVLGIEEK